PAAPIQPGDEIPASEDEQRRLERFKKYDPPLRGAAYDWWRTFELSSPDQAASLTWAQFSAMFEKEFVPQSLRDAWRAEFEHLRQGTMSVSEYAIRYTRLARHAPALVATVRERVRRFIEGLIPPIRSSMARELEIDIPYQQVVNIARRIEGLHARDREEREAMRVGSLFWHPDSSSSGTSAPPRPQEPYYAPPVSSAPPARGAHRGQSSRGGPSQSQPPRPPRACYECGDLRHMVRDCPRLGRGVSSQTPQPQHAPQSSQAMVPAPAATPPAQPARGGGSGGLSRCVPS
uniref:CCHC-type domain-containing protein n=1 Tax=Nicotiana tabacum TaxID=4097 RepID=A0A1S4DLF8_TOBAC